MPMSDTTPYWARPDKEVAQERDCMRQIFKSAKPVSLIYEGFGGVGVTAGVMAHRFPKAKILACDLDERCCVNYNQLVGAPHTCLNLDAARGLTQWTRQLRKAKGGWGASLDFNRFTMLDMTRPSGKWKRALINQVVREHPKWIQITDSAVCYLQVNWKRYGLLNKDLEGYVFELSRHLVTAWGLKLGAWAWHPRATYLRYDL